MNAIVSKLRSCIKRERNNIFISLNRRTTLNEKILENMFNDVKGLKKPI